MLTHLFHRSGENKRHPGCPIEFGMGADLSLSTLCTRQQPLFSSRWLDGVAQFSDKFGGAKPIAVARAPGRTNLIGDHVDYCLFVSVTSTFLTCMWDKN